MVGKIVTILTGLKKILPLVLVLLKLIKKIIRMIGSIFRKKPAKDTK